MLAQSVIALGTLVFRRTSATLQNYSVSMMSRMVENRKIILQNDMTQRWSAISSQEESMNLLVGEFLQENRVTLKYVLASKELRSQLLDELFPNCISLTENSMTTGAFVILTGEDFEGEEEFDGFFLRDSNPYANKVNYSDFMMERGNKQLSRAYGIPLDTYWTTAFAMSGQGQKAEEDFFYEPWRAARENPEAHTADLGYWSKPFILGAHYNDSHEMITYSIPLRYHGTVYGVMGVEISTSYLHEYMPVSDLSERDQAGYCLAVAGKDGTYTALTGRGVLYDLVREQADGFTMHDTMYENLSVVNNVSLGPERVFAVTFPLQLYGGYVPYDNSDWVLIGLSDEEELFGMMRMLYLWMIIALLIGLAFSFVGIYFTVHRLTSPIKSLMDCISEGRSGLEKFQLTNILEVDGLYDVVKDLTNRQKESEEVLREEKELYRLALETTRDTFFSYDFREQTVDIINNEKWNGRWKCTENMAGPMDLDRIYEEDREAFQELMELQRDSWSLEFRMQTEEGGEYRWTRMSGYVIQDTDGNRWKLVGSFHDIQEQKEREEQEHRKRTIDSVTGFYTYDAGMDKLRKVRKEHPVGTLVYFMLDNLRRMNEQNGITFGDMILEEIGHIMAGDAGRRSVEIRFDGDEFCVWLPNRTEQEAQAFVEHFFAQVRESFDENVFEISLHAGIAAAVKKRSTRELIRMAKQAQMAASRSVSAMGYCCYGKGNHRQESPGAGWRGKQIVTAEYGRNISLASLALTLFGRGDNMKAQMYLLFRKLGRYYDASDVLLTVIREDFHTIYPEYQWHRNAEDKRAGHTLVCRDEEWAKLADLMEENGFLAWSEDAPVSPDILKLCMAEGSSCGYVIPLYDSGRMMGTISILNGRVSEEDAAEAYKSLLELGSVIQSRINQKRYDLASKAKSDFLSRMSHEIRTPMNGIIGMTAIALQPDQSQERMEDCLHKIQISSNYLLGLINDILDMSKIESGKMQIESADFSMRELLTTVEEVIRPQAEAKSIEFVQDIHLEHDWFRADGLRISQVVVNLLGNAVKFTKEQGAVTLTIREEKCEGERADLYFSVQDNGIGISEEDQPRVFRAFEQAQSTTVSRQKGTGLGLSISSRLIQMMGGKIELESRLGEGSRFFFRITVPLGEAGEEEQDRQPVSFEGFRILVVEDNELNAEIATAILEDAHFQVDCVHDGSQAVQRMKETAPGTYDLILMDIMMPVMDGLDATRAIRAMDREDCRSIPIIAMSANAFDDDLKKSVECGMNGHLSKPVEIDKMYKVLRKILIDDKEELHEEK